MITLIELLEDPVYKAFLLKQPQIPKTAKANPSSPPWRLWVLLHGEFRWRKRDFDTYTEAFNFLKKKLKTGKIKDAAIHCKRVAFPPPIRLAKIKGKFIKGSDGKLRQATKYVEWTVKLPAEEPEAHRWCPYCRRPTVFKYYTRHHALDSIQGKGIMVDPSVKRCCICGSSERIVSYRSLL